MMTGNCLYQILRAAKIIPYRSIFFKVFPFSTFGFPKPAFLTNQPQFEVLRLNWCFVFMYLSLQKNMAAKKMEKTQALLKDDTAKLQKEKKELENTIVELKKVRCF